jgi:hypothetical protein
VAHWWGKAEPSAKIANLILRVGAAIVAASVGASHLCCGTSRLERHRKKKAANRAAYAISIWSLSPDN